MEFNELDFWGKMFIVSFGDFIESNATNNSSHNDLIV